MFLDIIPLRCPCCSSDKWVTSSLNNNKSGFSVGKAVAGAVLFGPIGVVSGALGKKHTYVTKVCQECHFSQIYQIK